MKIRQILPCLPALLAAASADVTPITSSFGIQKNGDTSFIFTDLSEGVSDMALTYDRTRLYRDEGRGDWRPAYFLNGAAVDYAPDADLRSALQVQGGYQDFWVLDFYVQNTASHPITLTQMDVDIVVMAGDGAPVHTTTSTYFSVESGTGVSLRVVRADGSKTPLTLSSTKEGVYYCDTELGTISHDLTIFNAEFASLVGDGRTDLTLNPGEKLYVSYTQNNQGYVPLYYGVKGVHMTYNVPEPATAGLSLLALAGLAARRRRG